MEDKEVLALKRKLITSIEKDCLDAFDKGAIAFKKSMIESLKEALSLMPNITGQSLFEIIKNVDVVKEANNEQNKESI
jgi:hypothetical protein